MAIIEKGIDEKVILIILESFDAFNENHPRYTEIAALASMYKELHILVLIKKYKKDIQQVVKIKDNTFVYHMQSRFLFMRYFYTLSILKKHLLWQKNFRPNRMLVYGIYTPLITTFLIRKVYKRPYLLYVPFNESPENLFSQNDIKSMFSKKGIMFARQVVVESEDVKSFLEKNIKETEGKITLLEPFFDFNLFEKTDVSVDFKKKYPRKSLFFSATVSGKNTTDIKFLCTIMKIIAAKYFQAGLVLFVPKNDIVKVKHVVKRNDCKDVIFVEASEGMLLEAYKGTRIFISPVSSDALHAAPLLALSVHVPVVSTNVGYVKKVFTNDLYTRYLCEPGDVECFVNNIFYLIDDSYVYNDYKFNTTIGLSNIAYESRDVYTQKLLSLLTPDTL